MTPEQFFSAYANVPIKTRFKALSVTAHGLDTLSDFYFRIKSLEDQMRTLRIEEQRLLSIVEPYLSKKEEKV